MLFAPDLKPHAGVWIVSRVNSPYIETLLPVLAGRKCNKAFVGDVPITPPAED